MVWLGKAWRGKVWQARLGAARSGEAWQGLAGKAWRGEAWRGKARPGMVWQARLIKQKEDVIMVYAWKTKYYDCDANVAGNELNRIYKKNGCLTPQSVVDESRSENAPLHKCFEWNDTTAANEYRKQQARVLIANITVVEEADEKTVEPVRAFYHIQQDYKPIDVVIKNADMMEELLEKAKKELNAFRRKYSALSQLQPIFDAIERMECA